VSLLAMHWTVKNGGRKDSIYGWSGITTILLLSTRTGTAIIGKLNKLSKAYGSFHPITVSGIVSAYLH
jgi:hypothetical protein